LLPYYKLDSLNTFLLILIAHTKKRGESKMCCHCGCGCGADYEEGHKHGRRFLTKAEKLEKLKSYAEELRKELTAVEENIKELKS
jgi:hypothetical protein